MGMKKRVTEQEIADCKELYQKYGGRHYLKIKKEMNEKGWTTFSTSRMSSYTKGEKETIGWVDSFGWADLLTADQKEKLPRCNSRRFGFPRWLKRTSPQWIWHWKYQKFLYKKLNRIMLGKSKRLMIFMPPRHGKSEMVTVRFTAWMLEMNPKLNVILGSYNQKLANRFSRKIRRVLEDSEYQRHAVSPKSKVQGPKFGKISARLNTAADWETAEGGGVRAVGVGGGVTGFGAGLIVIDDPVKSRAEAESATYRERTWDWFNDDIYTRLEPGAAIILIQTRWHEDDLAGRLLKEAEEEGGEKWDVICLPALAEEQIHNFKFQISNSEDTEPEYGFQISDFGRENSDGGDLVGIAESDNLKLEIRNLKSSDPLKRQPGEALCPQRFDEKALERIKRKLGSYSFSALYQQRPVPAGGGLFKREWFKKIVDKAPDGLKWKRGYDLAVSTKTSADYTASFRCAVDSIGNIYIEGGFRGRLEYPEQRRYMIGRMMAEKNTEHGIELALHGQAFVQDLRREVKLSNVPFRGVKVSGDKFTRALAWSNRAEEGKIILVRGSWISDFIEEACRFTGNGGGHDDQIDAVSLAVEMLGAGGNGFQTFR